MTNKKTSSKVATQAAKTLKSKDSSKIHKQKLIKQLQKKLKK